MVGRRSHRGAALARELVAEVAREIRLARSASGLSQRTVATAAGMSQSQVGRIERGQVRHPTLDQLCRVAAAVGLKLSIKAFPDGDPIRDIAHARLLERFHRQLGPGIGWRTEVPSTVRRTCAAGTACVSSHSSASVWRPKPGSATVRRPGAGRNASAMPIGRSAS